VYETPSLEEKNGGRTGGVKKKKLSREYMTVFKNRVQKSQKKTVD